MWKRLKKWHFDVAILLGLACFAWAYWYVKPRPAWTSYYASADPKLRYNFTVLGYSADDQSIYTAYEMWPFPRIQRWSVATGEIVEDITLEPTEEEQFIAKQPRKHFGYSGYDITLCDDRRHFLLRYDLAVQKDHQYLRVYGVDGKAVAHGMELPRYHRGELLQSDSPQQKYWLASTQLEPRQSEMRLIVFDLESRKPVREPIVFTRSNLNEFPNIIDGKFLTYVMKPMAKESLQMEIVDLLSGDSLGRIPVGTGLNHQNHLFPIDEAHWAVGSVVRNVNPAMYRTTIHFYRSDPQTKLIEQDNTHPFNGMSSENHWWLYVRSPYLVSIKDEEAQSSSVLVRNMMEWLSRLGIGRNGEGRTIKVARLSDGAPLRQCTGLPNGQVSPQMQSYLVNVLGARNEPGLSLYLIPHYAWEQTLSWLQWLAWLLVVPWPLRYFVRG